MLKIFTLIAIIAVFIINSAYSQYRLSGTVEDSISSERISSAKIEIYGTGNLRITNNKGEFSFDNLPSGLYTITISKEDYLSGFRSVVLDSLNRNADLRIYLHSFETVTDTIDVNAKYFKKTDDISTSYMNAEYEEIRKSPGAMEDVIRYFTSAPGVSLGNDINNEIIVRGGSPAENLT
jgi:iron complex outermembrane receptor protein